MNDAEKEPDCENGARPTVRSKLVWFVGLWTVSLLTVAGFAYGFRWMFETAGRLLAG